MRRDDLRIREYLSEPPTRGDYTRPYARLIHRPVTDADLASLGYVRRPACDKCKGRGTLTEDPRRFDGRTLTQWVGPRCPSCGGTGFGRLVALDGALIRRIIRLRSTESNVDLILAALDQEDTP